jgi:hypothetical protein
MQLGNRDVVPSFLNHPFTESINKIIKRKEKKEREKERERERRNYRHRRMNESGVEQGRKSQLGVESIQDNTHEVSASIGD